MTKQLKNDMTPLAKEILIYTLGVQIRVSKAKLKALQNRADKDTGYHRDEAVLKAEINRLIKENKILKS